MTNIYWDYRYGYVYDGPTGEIASGEAIARREAQEAQEAAEQEAFRLSELRSWLQAHHDEPLSGYRKRKNYSLLDFATVAQRLVFDGGPNPEVRNGKVYKQLVAWDRTQPSDQPRTGADFLAVLESLLGNR